MSRFIPAWQQNQKSILLKTFFLLFSVESLTAFLILLLIPTDPRKAFLLRYSADRALMLIAVLLVAALNVWLFLKAQRDLPWQEKITRGLDRFFSSVRPWKALTVILILGAAFGFGVLFLALFSPLLIESPIPLLVRLSPIVILAFLMIFQMAASLALWEEHPLQAVSTNIRANASLLRSAFLLFLLSFIIRLAFALPVIFANVQPRFDESAYMSRAAGFELAFHDTASGNLASVENLTEAYGEGRWPPLHSMLLGAALFFFGGQLAAARLALVLISALTTPLIYLLTNRLASSKAALAAGLLHVVYPSFIAYSHLLWSETAYMFFLLAAIVFTMWLLDVERFDTKILLAMLAGLALGLSGLTRASAALYLLLVPLWVFLAAQNTRQKIALPVVILLVSLITVLPWLLVLGDEEGHFMPLAATGSYNLYLGNNPWDADPRPTPLGYEGDTNQARRAINDYVDQHEIHPETAARRLALEEIRANPSGFVERSLARLRGFLGSDFFEIRHFAYAAYPPVPPAFILAMWALFILAFVLFLTFAITGLFGGAGLRHRNFILILALAGLVLPALTIANSRLYLPVLAILTPTAGAGIAAFRTLNRRRIFLTLMVALTIAAAVVASIPQTITRDLRPSLYYFDLIQGLKRFVPAEPFFSDGFLLHIDSPADDTLTVTILSEGLLFGENNARTLEWAVTKGPNEFSMTVYSDRPSPPLQIEIKSERLAQTITIEPIQRSTWWQWQPTELHGLEFMWAGGF